MSGTAPTPSQSVVDAICREIWLLHEIHDSVLNSEDKYSISSLFYLGEIVGLRKSLCVLFGWPKEESDKEGLADCYVTDWAEDHLHTCDHCGEFIAGLLVLGHVPETGHASPRYWHLNMKFWPECQEVGTAAGAQRIWCLHGTQISNDYPLSGAIDPWPCDQCTTFERLVMGRVIAS